MLTIQWTTLGAYAIPMLFAITVHEWAHGFVANCMGDRSAKMLGRLSLNPIRHIDPIGTLLVPTLLVLTTPYIFGWAKPVPINAQALPSRRHLAWVALAGPGSNVIMAMIWTLLYHLTNLPPLIEKMCQLGIQINLFLAALNLLPIPPLDGSRCVSALLPPRLSYYYDSIEPYGLWILLGLLMTGLLPICIEPVYDLLANFLTWLV